MKNFNITSEKIASIKPTRVGEDSKAKIEAHLPEGAVARQRHHNASSQAQPRDMIVRYQGALAVAKNYREAIRALGLSEQDEERYLRFENVRQMHSELTKIANDIKLWNYAPERREEIKEARAYLRQVLESKVEYGTERVVQADDIDAFFGENNHDFAVSEYYYCVGDIVLPGIEDAKEKLSDLSESMTEHFRDAEAKLIEAGREKLEVLSDKLPKNPIATGVDFFNSNKSA